MIYLDHAATTPLDPRVLEAMMPYLTSEFGNPSSTYEFGQRARRAIDQSREKIASLLNAKPKEIIFTSGGTEANNLFLLGLGQAALLDPNLSARRLIISTRIEHDSVIKPLEHLIEKGFEVAWLKVGEEGLVNPEDLRELLQKRGTETLCVSVMYANNEIGTVQPVREYAEVIREYREQQKNLFGQNLGENADAFSVLFHTDACQAAGYLSLDVESLGVDALTFNAGKIYGPKGVGALYVRGGSHGNIKLMPQLFGGGQEYRMRSGTENVAGIVGFARALELVQENREAEAARLTPLRDMLITGILKIPDTRLNGSPNNRLPNNVNVSFKGLHGESLLIRLDMAGICASSGSACSSGSLDPSHVILALGGEGKDEVWSRSATRFTLGHGNTEEEVHKVLAELPGIVADLRAISPF